MKTINILLALSLSFLLFNACENDKDCIYGSGSIQSRSYTISSFDELSIYGTADVYLTQSEETSLRIEAQTNVLDALHVKNDNGSLSIGRDNCFKDIIKLKIYTSTEMLSRIEIAGQSDVYTTGTFTGNNFEAVIDGSGSMNLNLNVQEFTSHISGEGDITANGNADSQKYIIDGSADIACFDLKGVNGDINISGSATLDINVSDKLNVKISGSGNIYYLGSPTINKDISGTGNIVDAN